MKIDVLLVIGAVPESVDGHHGPGSRTPRMMETLMPAKGHWKRVDLPGQRTIGTCLWPWIRFAAPLSSYVVCSASELVRKVQALRTPQEEGHAPRDEVGDSDDLTLGDMLPAMSVIDVHNSLDDIAASVLAAMANDDDDVWRFIVTRFGARYVIQIGHSCDTEDFTRLDRTFTYVLDKSETGFAYCLPPYSPGSVCIASIRMCARSIGNLHVCIRVCLGACESTNASSLSK